MLLNLVYAAVLLLFSPVLLYGAIRYGKYRSGWQQKLWGMVPHFAELDAGRHSQRIWIHAVSVGEVNLADGLARRLLAAKPGLDIVVSTTTVTGFELAKKRFPEANVFYCPMDFSWAIRRALRRIAPDLIILVELEIWPNWLKLAERTKIPIAVVNGRLSEKSFQGYRRIRALLKKTFARVSLVTAQDDTYAYRFREMGVPEDSVRTTGSLKFDDAPTTRHSLQINQFKQLARVAEDHVVFVAGSTQAGEEAVSLAAYQDLRQTFTQLRMIVVPRHAERFGAVAEEIAEHGFVCVRRSQLSEHAECPPKSDMEEVQGRVWESNEVLLVDTIGELRGWWGLADLAFVGGSLGNRGGQNMLEPCGYGAAVCFGPNTRNFRDIVAELLAANAARVVVDVQSLRTFIAEMLEHPDAALQMGKAAQQLIKSHQGAGQQTVDLLLGLLVDDTSSDTDNDQNKHNRGRGQSTRPDWNSFENQQG